MSHRAIKAPLVALAILLSLTAAARSAKPTANERTCFAVATTVLANRGRVAACSALLRGADSDAERARILIARADSYYRSDSNMRALGDLQQLEALDPSRLEIAYGRALVYVSLGFYARAEPEIERAIRGGVHSATAYGLRGTINAHQGRYGDAIQDLDFSLIEDPTLAPSYSIRGFANLETGEIERALKDFDSAIRLHAQDEFTLYYRGRAHLALDQYQEALADFEQARSLTDYKQAASDYVDQIKAMAAAPPPAPPPPPDDPNAVVPSRAVGHSHNCAAYYPSLSNWLGEAGDVLIHYDVGADGAITNVGIGQSSGFDRLDRAAVVCVSRHWRNTPGTRAGVAFATPGHQAIIRYTNNNGGPFYDRRRGEALDGLGDYAGANAAFDAAVVANPSDFETYFNRGLTHYVQGDWSEAARDFDKALTLKPDSDDALAGRDLAKGAALAAVPPGKGI